jgi:hypothetical protein
MLNSITVTHDDLSTTDVAVDRTVVNALHAAYKGGTLSTFAEIATALVGTPASPANQIDVAHDGVTAILLDSDDVPTTDAFIAELDGELFNIGKKGTTYP